MQNSVFSSIGFCVFVCLLYYAKKLRFIDKGRLDIKGAFRRVVSFAFALSIPSCSSFL